MASLQISIDPIQVPESVVVRVPGTDGVVRVPISELDADTISELLEEFSANLLAAIEK